MDNSAPPYGAERDAASPSDVAAPTLDLSIYRRVSEVWFLVKDVNRTAIYWERLGINAIRRIGTQAAAIRCRGRESEAILKLASAYIGDVKIVWAEPVSGMPDFDAFLKRRGDGVHHLTFAVRSVEEMRREIQGFHSRHFGVSMEGTWKSDQGDRQFAYLDTSGSGGGITLLPGSQRPLVGVDPSSSEPCERAASLGVLTSSVRLLLVSCHALFFG